MSAHEDSPFHAGELALQRQFDVRARAEQIGQMMIRDAMPEQHREFFATLPFVLVGSLDPAGRPWASLLSGAPGFLHSPDPEHLEVSASAWPGDPLAQALQLGAPLGLLGIQLETRRRNRLNGRINALAQGGFSLRVDQSFGNCPRYITARAPSHIELARLPPRPEGAQLSTDALALIAGADTCFVASASASAPALSDPREGVDVSHRGGPHGFVRAELVGDATVLTMPEFDGNKMFNTMGNLVRYPRAGMLFLDFVSGDLLQVTCTSELVFAGAELERFRGAQRVLRFTVDSGLFYRRALPFVWSAGEPSAQHDKLGAWPDALDGTEKS